MVFRFFVYLRGSLMRIWNCRRFFVRVMSPSFRVRQEVVVYDASEGLVSQAVYFTSKLHDFPVESNSLSHFYEPLDQKILLGCLPPSSLRLSWWSPRLQKGFPWWSPQAREEEKVTWSKIKWTWRLFQYGDVLLGQELRDALYALSWWAARMQLFTTPSASSSS